MKATIKVGRMLNATPYLVGCAGFHSLSSTRESTFEMEMHCHPNSEWCALLCASHSPRQRTLRTDPGSQVLAKLRQEIRGSLCPGEPLTSLGWNPDFYDDWVGTVGFRVEDADLTLGHLILHAGFRQATWLPFIHQ